MRHGLIWKFLFFSQTEVFTIWSYPSVKLISDVTDRKGLLTLSLTLVRITQYTTRC